jgi:hypothetical protein
MRKYEEYGTYLVSAFHTYLVEFAYKGWDSRLDMGTVVK